MSTAEHQHEYYLKVTKAKSPSHVNPCPDCKGRKMRTGHKGVHTTGLIKGTPEYNAYQAKKANFWNRTPEGVAYRKAYLKSYRRKPLTPEQKAQEVIRISAYRKTPEGREKTNA